ncbi:CinA family protein [Vibrio gallicus]|uniref:CinA family protein n=1 Tax=Vibrio gallicus TaxID=190897 RepID=UPI0021C26B78|nr:CinA family protein [Vibrio gallicus]
MNDLCLLSLSKDVGQLLKKQGWMLATAESCTGGGVAQTVTEIAGSSAWFDRAFITYSNEAKHEMLGVNPKLIQQHGAVSEEVATEMALGALVHSNASIAVSITGIAGPGGGSDAKPVGTVCFALAVLSEVIQVNTVHFTGDRGEVRNKSIQYSLQLIEKYI